MFEIDVCNQLCNYVYRLIDPRNGNTFYVGRGYGNRVFDHLNEALKFEDGEDALSTKLSIIRQIKNSGLETIHIIHRHGMKEEESREVEAALIDVYPGLSNLQGGYHSGERGPMNTKEIEQIYALEQIPDDCEHKFIAININKTIADKSIYDAVRCAWRISLQRAEKADYVFAVSNGVCRGVYCVDEWLPATVDNFQGLIPEDIPERCGFIGIEAPQEILNLYLGKKLPERMKREKGMAAPFLYSYE